MNKKKIYVMEADGRYKIGISKDPKSRLNALRCASPHIKLVYQSEMVSNPFELENMIHKELKKLSIGNEWFCVDDEKALINAIKNIVLNNKENSDNEVIEKNGIDDKMQRMVDFALGGYYKHINKLNEELDKEIEEINAENQRLIEILKDMGYEDFDIEMIIKTALKEQGLL